jgi:hypothetical protein
MFCIAWYLYVWTYIYTHVFFRKDERKYTNITDLILRLLCKRSFQAGGDSVLKSTACYLCANWAYLLLKTELSVLRLKKSCCIQYSGIYKRFTIVDTLSLTVVSLSLLHTKELHGIILNLLKWCDILLMKRKWLLESVYMLISGRDSWGENTLWVLVS